MIAAAEDRNGASGMMAEAPVSDVGEAGVIQCLPAA
jgi:hypothetical protein